MRLRFDGHGPVLAPLAFEASLGVFVADVLASGDSAQVRQLIRRADAEHLAQVEGKEHRLTRVLANHPLRSPGSAHAASLNRTRDFERCSVRPRDAVPRDHPVVETVGFARSLDHPMQSRGRGMPGPASASVQATRR